MDDYADKRFRSATRARGIVTERGHRHAVSMPVVSGLMQGIDALVLAFTGIISYEVYVGWIKGGPTEQYGLYAGIVILGVLLQMNFALEAKLYKLERLRQPYHQIIRCGAVWALALLCLIALGFLTKTSELFSRGWVILWFASGFVGVIGARLAIASRISNWTKEGRLQRRVAIVGSGEQAQRFLCRLEDWETSSIEIVGVFDDRIGRTPEQIEGHAYAGTTDDLISYAREYRVDEILVALPWTAEDRLLELIKKLQVLPVDVGLSSDLVGYRLPQFAIEMLDEIPVVRVAHKPLSDWKLVSKGLEDRIVVVLILLFIWPILLFIAALIKITSPGPILFRQQRYGFNNQIIEVLKFRSMYQECTDIDADQQTTRDDTRITPLGRILRRTSLDELPQILNVLRGEMSLVGPRPHAKKTKAAGRLFEEVINEYASRHRVKPGITGWAQVNGWRGETDTEEKIKKRVEHDLYYIENWSVGLDLKILLMTIFVVLKGNNAY